MDLQLVTNELYEDISKLIESTKTYVAKKINSSLVLLYWQIGCRINTELLNDERAEYGKGIIKQLSHDLRNQYGRGFNERTLFRMVRFAKHYPDQEIVATLSPLLSWSHFVELIAFDDPLKQQFYTQMCRLEHWSVRELRKKIDGMLYERTGISQKPAELAQQ